MLNLGQCAVSEPVERMLDTMFVQKRVPQALIIEGNHVAHAVVASKRMPVLIRIFI